MLGSLMIVPGGAALPNPWKPWLDHILQSAKDNNHNVQQAALIYNNGVTVAATKKFFLVPQEVKNLHNYFNCGDCDSLVRLQNKSYIVKHNSERQLVAFNGNKYLIVSKTDRFFIVVICKVHKKRQSEASSLFKKLSEKLISKGF